MQRPLLTVAIPTYNGTKTIRNMLDLLLLQYDPRVEIIVSDNCSTDGTTEMIKEYRERYPFIQHVINPENIGPDANFLQCMQLANGMYTYLLSDDDILVEGGLRRILDFLEENPDVSLVYLSTIGFIDHYIDIDHCFIARRIKKPPENICTNDKHKFIEYANYYWGFMSSFLWATDRFREIDHPERFFGTYWLQSYIHISCVAKPNTKLGIIAKPVVAAGNYINVANFDTALIDGVYYREMLDFAVQAAGFDQKQLDKLYVWRISLLGRNALIKERASGIRKINEKLLKECVRKYPLARMRIYPFLYLPRFMIIFIMWAWNLKHGLKNRISIHRPE